MLLTSANGLARITFGTVFSTSVPPLAMMPRTIAAFASASTASRPSTDRCDENVPSLRKPRPAITTFAPSIRPFRPPVPLTSLPSDLASSIRLTRFMRTACRPGSNANCSPTTSARATSAIAANSSAAVSNENDR